MQLGIVKHSNANLEDGVLLVTLEKYTNGTHTIHLVVPESKVFIDVAERLCSGKEAFVGATVSKEDTSALGYSSSTASVSNSGRQRRPKDEVVIMSNTGQGHDQEERHTVVEQQR
jgi:hypothetical protein